MNFVSGWAFVSLFSAVMASRLLFGRRKTERPFVWFTIIASTIFEMWHVPIYILIMLTSISVDYAAALVIDRAPPVWPWRKAVLAVSMTTNLFILGFFKYADFALDLVKAFAEPHGAERASTCVGLILPIGISFYTFGSMSYTIDVYRGRLRAIRRFQDFYYFVTFFPHMVAGPIVRAEQFFYQFARTRRLRLKVVNHAAFFNHKGPVSEDGLPGQSRENRDGVLRPTSYPRRCAGTPLADTSCSSNLFVLALSYSGLRLLLRL